MEISTRCEVAEKFCWPFLIMNFISILSRLPGAVPHGEFFRFFGNKTLFVPYVLPRRGQLFPLMVYPYGFKGTLRRVDSDRSGF
jgi:hypothetical protein